MFYVKRSTPPPACLSSKKYNTPEVIDILKILFHEKCYLCERDEIQDVEIEHLDPHEGDDALKYNWENLFYSCSRCNSIKSNKHKNIIDCCQEEQLGEIIQYYMPPTPNRDVEIIQIQETNKTLQFENTITLLKECYNNTSTGLRGISRTALLDKMWEHYTLLLDKKLILRNKSTGKTEQEKVKEEIQAMLSIKYPFSSFWRTYCREDTSLLTKYPDLFEIEA